MHFCKLVLSGVTKGKEAANKGLNMNFFNFFYFLEIYGGTIQYNWPRKAAESWLGDKGQNIGRLWDL